MTLSALVVAVVVAVAPAPTSPSPGTGTPLPVPDPYSLHFSAAFRDSFVTACQKTGIPSTPLKVAYCECVMTRVETRLTMAEAVDLIEHKPKDFDALAHEEAVICGHRVGMTLREPATPVPSPRPTT